MKDEDNVISDKAEKAEVLNKVKVDSGNRYVSQETTVGVSVDECPMLPLGNQILLEYNLIHEKAGLKLLEPMIKFRFPKVVGHGKLVKSVNIGDHIILKDAAGNISSEVIDGYKFHVVYETSILGIYKGKNPEELQTKDIAKPTIIV